MRKRAEQVDETRQRIVDATVKLHTTIGPSNTTISGVAEEAGVTRLTVYRHFESEEALFAACRHRWISLHPRPDPAAWVEIGSLEDRARHALGDLYGWYDRNGDDLYPIQRDAATMPARVRRANAAGDAATADAIVRGCRARGKARRRLRAAAGLVVRYWTWRTLVREQGLDTEDAVEVGVRLLVAMAAER